MKLLLSIVFLLTALNLNAQTAGQLTVTVVTPANVAGFSNITIN